MGKKREAGDRLPNEPVSPRIIDVKRPATRGREEDEAWAGGNAYERRGYERHEGQSGRAYDKAYHPADKAYHPSYGAPSRAYGKEYHPAPTQDYERKYRPSSVDYSDDYEYTHIPPRAQSPERRDYNRDASRRPRYAEDDPYMSGGLRGRDDPYMSGGPHEREKPYLSGGVRNREEEPRENPFAPMRR